FQAARGNCGTLLPRHSNDRHGGGAESTLCRTLPNSLPTLMANARPNCQMAFSGAHSRRSVGLSRRHSAQLGGADRTAGAGRLVDGAQQAHGLYRVTRVDGGCGPLVERPDDVPPLVEVAG